MPNMNDALNANEFGDVMSWVLNCTTAFCPTLVEVRHAIDQLWDDTPRYLRFHFGSPFGVDSATGRRCQFCHRAANDLSAGHPPDEEIQMWFEGPPAIDWDDAEEPIQITSGGRRAAHIGQANANQDAVNALTQAYTADKDAIILWIERGYSRLKRLNLAEDVVAKANIELLSYALGGGQPKVSWQAMLWSYAKWRARDLNRREGRYEVAGPAQRQVAAREQIVIDLADDPGPDPERREKRSRQIGAAYPALRLFCAQRAAQGDIGLRRREIFERTVRGQKRSEVLSAMGIDEAVYDNDRRSNIDLAEKLLKAHDPRHTIFLTAGGLYDIPPHE